MAGNRIEPGANPGGLVAHLYVGGRLVDSSPLTDATTAGIAHRHASWVTADNVGTGPVQVRIFDGDTGRLVAVLEAGDDA